MAVLSVMGVLRSACEKAAATALSSGNIIPTLKNGFTIAHDQAGSGSGAGSGSVGVKGRGRGRQVVDMLLPSGAALESYFEQQGIGRMQEGKKLKMLSSLVLEVREKHPCLPYPPSLPPSLPSFYHRSLPYFSPNRNCNSHFFSSPSSSSSTSFTNEGIRLSLWSQQQQQQQLCTCSRRQP